MPPGLQDLKKKKKKIKKTEANTVRIWYIRNGAFLGWKDLLQEERSPAGGNDNPLQYCSLENSMDRKVWQAIVNGVTKNQTQLSNLACTHI